ncbi:MAG: hypothetical protein RE471_05495 [Ferroplasma sp.]|uniref:hypothetical protein n=1 Tax=Ferroplasma sp. TaxID=2591003 RepID=UPI002815C960|nr:hypothetical protein [Ferroplasma sp.]WMT50436.1 MAG: hypothetical protein RE471_05495 [Ferroplasma sp.]
MDKYVLSILSSLDFPSRIYYKFSDRPTAYVISKRYGYPPVSIYKTWKNLETTGTLNGLILLPAFNRKFYYIITGISLSNIHIMEYNLGHLYFLEYFCPIKIYRGMHRGDKISCSDAIFVSILADSQTRGYSSSIILCSMMGVDFNNIMDINDIAGDELYIREQTKLLSYLSYSDISTLNFAMISEKMNISERSARRQLDVLLQQGKLELLPVIDQTRIPGINTATAVIMKSSVKGNKINEISIAKAPLKIWVKERHSFYSIFFMYSTLEHLDAISEELDKDEIDYFIFVRFRTIFNTGIRENLYSKREP